MRIETELKMYCCHIRTEATQSPLSSLYSVQNIYAALCGMNYVLRYNSFRIEEKLLASRYFDDKYSSELHSIVPLDQRLTSRRLHAIQTWLNHPHLHFSNKFFIRSVNFWHKFQRACFFDFWNIILSKSKVKLKSYIYHSIHLLFSPCRPKTIIQ